MEALPSLGRQARLSQDSAAQTQEPAQQRDAAAKGHPSSRALSSQMLGEQKLGYPGTQSLSGCPSSWQ